MVHVSGRVMLGPVQSVGSLSAAAKDFSPGMRV